MPNYEYRCKSCSYEFEEFQKITDSALVNCPECKTDNLVRLIHGGAGLHFKGSGFYLTDYKKSNTSGSSSETKPATESGTKTETKKTETKSPEKSTSKDT
jgi:putative FmdB family regulatory protein